MVFREWACGAAGSALPWHGRGHRFDPDQVHQTTYRKINHLEQGPEYRTDIVQRPILSLCAFAAQGKECSHALALYPPLRALQTGRHFLPPLQMPQVGSGKSSRWPLPAQVRQDAELEKAELLCRRLEDESDPNKPEARPRAKIVEAIQTFRDDEDSRRLTEGTLKKSRYFFETQLKEWAKNEGIVYLDQLTPAVLTKFRSGWTNAAQTMQRKHERLIAFLWFCVRMDWMTKNPRHPPETGQGRAYPHGLLPERRVQGAGGRNLCLWRLAGRP